MESSIDADYGAYEVVFGHSGILMNFICQKFNLDGNLTNTIRDFLPEHEIHISILRDSFLIILKKLNLFLPNLKQLSRHLGRNDSHSKSIKGMWISSLSKLREMELHSALLFEEATQASALVTKVHSNYNKVMKEITIKGRSKQTNKASVTRKSIKNFNRLANRLIIADDKWRLNQAIYTLASQIIEESGKWEQDQAEISHRVKEAAVAKQAGSMVDEFMEQMYGVT